MNTVLLKNTFRLIRKSLGRFLAIVCILALGVGFFSGLTVTKSTMRQTADSYVKDSVLYDFKLISTLGFDTEELEALRGCEGVQAVAGGYFCDVLEHTDKGDRVLSALSLTEGMNLPQVTEGRLPQQAGECLVDARVFSSERLGTTLFLSQANHEDTLKNFSATEYTVVGLCNSPEYMHMQRGTSKLGNGKVEGFVYLTEADFTGEYYSCAYVKMAGEPTVFTEAYDNAMEALKPVLTQKAEDTVTWRFDSLVADAKKEIADGEKELQEAKEELDRGKADLAEGEQELQKAKEELEQGRKDLAEGEKELQEAKEELEQGKAELAEGELKLQEARKAYEEGELKLQEAWEEWNQGFALWDAQRLQLEEGEAKLKEAKEKLQQLQASGVLGSLALRELSIQIDREQARLTEARKALEEAKAQIDQGEIVLKENQETLMQSLLELQRGEEKLQQAREEIAEGEKKLRDGQEELKKAREEIARGEQEIAKGEEELRQARVEIAEGEQEIADGEKELQKAKTDLESLEAPEVFNLTRYENVGFATFESDSTIVEGIAKVFPVLFFLVAALVCSTTMNKMVDNARTEMGTLKAVGYSDTAVVSQYLLYAFLAALLGTLIGFFGVSRLFPWVIWIAYTMMYDFTDSLVYVFDPLLMLISFLAALLCSVGVAFVSCKGCLGELPASLIRPKAPKAGKRILLERLPFFWKRLGFFGKVSLRNLFRYKKRFVMMVLGIGGCMALLCVGFGLRDSIKNLVNYQYDEITVYDAAFTFREPVEDSWEQFLSDTEAYVESGVLLYEQSAELKVGDRSKKLSMIVGGEEGLKDLVLLHNKGQAIAYPKAGEAVLNRKMAEQGGYRVGDPLILSLDGGQSISVTLSGICESYVSNYVYLNHETYREATGAEPLYKTAYVRFVSGADHHEAAARCREAAEITNASLTLDMKNNVSQMMASMDYVILLVVGCAAALALVVLFNLGNINIMERQREIATLKVLGFQLSEVNHYVFRENLVLSIIGTLLGVPLGKLLHAFVMGEIRIDLVTFEVRIAPESMLICAALTVAFTLAVNWILIPKLKRIEMATSLKSVE